MVRFGMITASIYESVRSVNAERKSTEPDSGESLHDFMKTLLYLGDMPYASA